MRISIHIGSHKAGSTAVQQTCILESERLSQIGVCYPIGLFPNYPNQHSEIVDLINANNDEALALKVQEIAGRCAKTGATRAFLSGENLCTGIGGNGIERFAAHLKAHFTDIDIILVLRNKSDYFLSHFNHFMRHSRDPVSIEDFRRTIKFSPCQTIDDWRKAFGHEAVKLFKYDSDPGEPQFLRRFFEKFF